MGSGISKEIFSSGDVLINSIDFDPAGRVMWISDTAGGVTHLDTRLDQSKATWYGLSPEKIGSVSVNPTRPHFLLTASNSRALRFPCLTSKFFGLSNLVFPEFGTRESYPDFQEARSHLHSLPSSTITQPWKSSTRVLTVLRC